MQAAKKEDAHFKKWKSLRPLNQSEIKKIMSNPILRKRILKARATYRDKSCGAKEIPDAKCRIVIIGCNHPNLSTLNRYSPTPTDMSFMVAAQVYSSGHYDEDGQWLMAVGDIESAFLTGRAKDRKGPLVYVSATGPYP